MTFSFLELLAHKLTGILALAFAFVLPPFSWGKGQTDGRLLRETKLSC